LTYHIHIMLSRLSTSTAPSPYTLRHRTFRKFHQKDPILLQFNAVPACSTHKRHRLLLLRATRIFFQIILVMSDVRSKLLQHY